MLRRLQQKCCRLKSNRKNWLLMGNNYLWHKLFTACLNCQSSWKRMAWLVQPCRQRGKDEHSKHNSFEQNECGYSFLIHTEFLLSHSGHPDFTGWLVVFAGVAVLSSILNSGDDLLWKVLCFQRSLHVHEKAQFYIFGSQTCARMLPGLIIYWAQWNYACVWCLCICAICKIKPALKCLLGFGS